MQSELIVYALVRFSVKSPVRMTKRISYASGIYVSRLSAAEIYIFIILAQCLKRILKTNIFLHHVLFML